MLNERLNSLFNFITQAVLLLVVFLFPLLFWNLTTEFFELPKFLLLLFGAGILLVVWTIRSLISGKVTLARTPFDFPLLLMLVVLALSTLFAPTKPVAFFGNFPKIQGGLVTFTTLIIFYFALMANLANFQPPDLSKTIKKALSLLLLSGFFLSTLTLLAFVGKNVLAQTWTNSLNFTPTGSGFSTATFLILLLPLPLVSLLSPSAGKESVNSQTSDKAHKTQTSVGKSLVKMFPNLISKTTATCLILLFTATIILTGPLATLIALVMVSLLVLVITPKPQIKKSAIFLFVSLLTSVAIFLFSTFPWGGQQNLLYTQAKNYPREVQLPFDVSWKISASAFRDSPFWGTGPASFLFDFSLYKPAQINQSPLWTTRFDQAFNEYLQFLATLGFLGLAAILLLAFISLSRALKSLNFSQENITNLPLAVSTIALFLILALHSSSLVLWTTGILILAFFSASQKNTLQLLQVGVTSKNSSHQGSNLSFNILPGVILTLVLSLVGISFYFAAKYTLADYHHRLALNAVLNNKALEAYNQLNEAKNLNPYVDLYRIDLAQTNLVLANALASSKLSNDGSSGANLTDQDKQNIQALLSQAISEGRAATVISPQNPFNWEVLGIVYRQIVNVAQNALPFSLDSYGRAIQSDPLNPSLRIILGEIHYSVKNYDLAIRFFTDALTLKPDLAKAHYNLALGLRDKGDLEAAIKSAEKAVSLIEPENPDYKVAGELLSQLKDKLASKSAQVEETKTPFKNSKGSALQDKKLPKVLDLPKPENIATPEAVKK